MYSLVNIAVVCRDLARNPHGRALVDDLLRAFALDPERLSALDECGVPARDDVRRGALEAARSRPRALQVLAAARAASEEFGPVAWTASLELLDTAPLGDVDALLAFTAEDVLAAQERIDDLTVTRWPRAVAIVTDGVLASYVGPDASELGAPWRAWTATNDVHPPVVEDVALRAVVAAVAGADADELEAVGEELRAARARGWSWATAMHNACWAVRLTGRGRTAAVAQLHALAHVLAVTAPLAPRPDVVSAVVAAVASAAVDDLLDTATARAMTQPVLRLLS